MLSDLHNHSTFSDGKNTCEELIKQAISLGLQRIGLVEHVWRSSEWVLEFIDTADRLKDKYGDAIQIVTGLEAKALTCSGEIDLNDKWADKVDFVLGAIHRIPSGSNQYYSTGDKLLDKAKVFDDWLSTIEGMLKNSRVDIIAHPAAELTHYQISLDSPTIIRLCDLGKRYGKIFEVNIKHRVPVPEFLEQLIDRNIPLSIGSDSHSTADQLYYMKDIIIMHKAIASCNLF